MALCCQNRVSKGTNQCYELHNSASHSVYSASVTVLGFFRGRRMRRKISTKRRFSCFQVSHLKCSNDTYKWLR